TSESRQVEAGIVPEVAALVREIPDPSKAESGQCQQDRHHEGREEILAAPRELESLAAEVGMRDEEGLPIHLKKGSIQAEGDGGEEAAPHEDLDEIPHVAAKGETNTSPRG